MKEALQNAKVWARRMGVEVDPTKLEALLNQNFPGSVLRGPLSAVMMRYYKDKIMDNKYRMCVGVITAYTVVAIIREEFKSSSNVLEIAAGLVKEMSDSYKTAFAMHSQLICDTVVYAITARAKEKATPNVANLILNKIK